MDKFHYMRTFNMGFDKAMEEMDVTYEAWVRELEVEAAAEMETLTIERQETHILPERGLVIMFVWYNLREKGAE